MAKAKNATPDTGSENGAQTHQAPTPTKPQPITFSEWEVKITGKEYEKLKVKRPRVVITQEDADILNTGVLEGGNTYTVMYFKNED